MSACIFKFVDIASILLARIIRLTVSLVGKKLPLLRSDSSFFFATEAFVAGVILATGFVNEPATRYATLALSNPCLPNIPLSNFPFSGFSAMMAALATLIADFISTEYYDSKQEKHIAVAGIELDDLASVVLRLMVKEGGVEGGEVQMHDHSDVLNRILRSTMMADFFVTTAPISVGLGIGISLSYNPDSANAFVIEGILDSISAGILVYMALVVDLIAAEFLSKRMRSNLGEQMVSFVSPDLGAGLMASLAAWA